LGKGTQFKVILKIIDEMSDNHSSYVKTSLEYLFKWKPLDGSIVEYINDFEKKQIQDSFNLSCSQNESSIQVVNINHYANEHSNVSTSRNINELSNSLTLRNLIHKERKAAQKILIVDDENFNIEAFRMVLESVFKIKDL